MGKIKEKNKHKIGNKKTCADLRAKKDLSVFRVAGSKVNKMKKRAKPVTSTLKKLDNRPLTSTEKADAAFSDVRTKVVNTHKAAPASKSKPKVIQHADNTSLPVDMDAAASEFAKL